MMVRPTQKIFGNNFQRCKNKDYYSQDQDEIARALHESKCKPLPLSRNLYSAICTR